MNEMEFLSSPPLVLYSPTASATIVKPNGVRVPRQMTLDTLDNRIIEPYTKERTKWWKHSIVQPLHLSQNPSFGAYNQQITLAHDLKAFSKYIFNTETASFHLFPTVNELI